MSDGFTVEPDTLPPVADRLQRTAESLRGSWQAVRSDTESVHFGRGDDVLSPLIQVSLQAATAMLDSCITTTARSLDGYATGLRTMAETYRSTEEQTTTMLKAP